MGLAPRLMRRNRCRGATPCRYGAPTAVPPEQKFRLNQMCVIGCRRAMDWRSFLIFPWEKRTAVAGVTAAAVVLGAIAVVLASSSSATSAGEGAAQSGKASLTVDLPPPANDRIYGAPSAR